MRLWHGINISALTYGEQVQPNWVPIPYGTQLSILLKAGTLGGFNLSISILPEDGSVFDISGIDLNVPDGVAVTILADTGKGVKPIAVDVDTQTSIKLDNFGYLNGIKFYITTIRTLPSDGELLAKFYGKEVVL